MKSQKSEKKSVPDYQEIEDILFAWENKLNENLNFPFGAEVSEEQEKGFLKGGDKVKVTKIIMGDEFYGINVELRYKQKKYSFPLCDLEVIADDSNSRLVQEYCDWFVERY